MEILLEHGLLNKKKTTKSTHNRQNNHITNIQKSVEFKTSFLKVKIK